MKTFSFKTVVVVLVVVAVMAVSVFSIVKLYGHDEMLQADAVRIDTVSNDLRLTVKVVNEHTEALEKVMKRLDRLEDDDDDDDN